MEFYDDFYRKCNSILRIFYFFELAPDPVFWAKNNKGFLKIRANPGLKFCQRQAEKVRFFLKITIISTKSTIKMATSFSINIDDYLRKTGRLAGSLSKSQVDTVLSRTINRTLNTGRTAGVRDIRKEYPGVTQRDLEGKPKGGGKGTKMFVSNATKAKLTGSLNATGTPMSLRAFKPRQVRRGVTVRIKGTRVLFPHSFLIKKFGNTVFSRGNYRTGGGFDYRNKRVNTKKGSSDLPITTRVTVSQGVMFYNPSVMSKTLKRINEIFPKRFEHEISYILSGLHRP